MSVRGLHILVGKAVISDEFRDGILNGRRDELIRSFDLEPEEVAEVMAIQANTLEEFAAAVEQIVESREHPIWEVADDPERALNLSITGFIVDPRNRTRKRAEIR